MEIKIKTALKRLLSTFPTMNSQIEKVWAIDPKWGLREEYTLWVAATKHYESFEDLEALLVEVDLVIAEYDRESLGN